MEECGYKKNCITGCNILVILISIIIGVIVGVLFSMGLITSTLNFIIIALIASAVSIATLVGSLFSANTVKGYNVFTKCICLNGICVLISTIGTFLASTIAATIGLVITSIPSILFVGLSAFFFVWMIISVVSLISCVIREICKCCRS